MIIITHIATNSHETRSQVSGYLEGEKDKNISGAWVTNLSLDKFRRNYEIRYKDVWLISSLHWKSSQTGLVGQPPGIA